MYLIVSEYFVLFRPFSILITWLLHRNWHKSGKGVEGVERIAFCTYEQVLISIIPCYSWSGDSFTPKLEACHWQKIIFSILPVVFNIPPVSKICYTTKSNYYYYYFYFLLVVPDSYTRSKTEFSFRGDINFFNC